MVDEVVQEEIAAEMDEGFMRVSAEVRRLEKKALAMKAKTIQGGDIFDRFDVEKISIDSYEVARDSAKNIERSGIRGRKVGGETAVAERFLSEEDLELIPKEKVEVVARTEQEILDEERKLRGMKEKFAKLILELPEEKPRKPEESMVLEEAAKKSEEKPAEEGRSEEIRELSENFKKIMVKKEEREKRERIRKMKKEIEDMMEGG